MQPVLCAVCAVGCRPALSSRCRTSLCLCNAGQRVWRGVAFVRVVKALYAIYVLCSLEHVQMVNIFCARGANGVFRVRQRQRVRLAMGVLY
jgi:hypothetical protein